MDYSPHDVLGRRAPLLLRRRRRQRLRRCLRRTRALVAACAVRAISPVTLRRPAAPRATSLPCTRATSARTASPFSSTLPPPKISASRRALGAFRDNDDNDGAYCDGGGSVEGDGTNMEMMDTADARDMYNTS